MFILHTKPISANKTLSEHVCPLQVQIRAGIRHRHLRRFAHIREGLEERHHTAEAHREKHRL